MPALTTVERLRLNADLMRLVRQLATLKPGPGYPLAQARIASQLTATLNALAVAPGGVSIYNSGSTPPEPTMTPPANPLIKRLLPVYAKHGDALAAVREAEAAGEKVTGLMKAAVTRTRTAVNDELNRYNDYGRKPENAPTIEELAAAYDAQVAAEKAAREAMANAPTLTLDELTEQAKQALEKLTPNAKWGTREATVSTMAADGSVITCIAMDDRRRSSYGYGWDVKRVYQYKRDGKVISKQSLLDLVGGKRKQDINEELRSAFEAQAPALEEDYRSYIVRAFEYQKEKNGGKVPAWVNEKDPAAEVIAELRMHSKVRKAAGEDSWLELDVPKLAQVAKEYGEQVAVQWYYKTNAKLGALDKPKLHSDRGGFVVVSGQRAGHKVLMRQQRVLKAAPTTGRLFHQFPALLYVDDKFTTEAAYAKLFGDKPGA